METWIQEGEALRLAERVSDGSSKAFELHRSARLGLIWSGWILRPEGCANSDLELKGGFSSVNTACFLEEQQVERCVDE